MNQDTQFFFELTPERILDSVEGLGVRCTGRCLALNSMENRVYDVEIELPPDVEQKSRYDSSRVVKFYRPGRWSKEQILEEHSFITELAQNDLPVVPPLAFDDGSTLRKCEEADIWFTVFPKIGGRLMDELDDQRLERMGRLLARMHVIGASKPAEHRIELTPATYGRQSLEFLLSHDSLPPETADRYRDIVERILDTVEPWFEGVETQRLHGDAHVGNILWDYEECVVVDFDDMVRGPAVQDLWLITPGRDEETLRQREIVLAAYEQFKEFDRSTLRLIEPLRALRMVYFDAWIARRWDDPAFQRTFVDFGSHRYWNEQLGALMETMQVLHGGLT